VGISSPRDEARARSILRAIGECTGSPPDRLTPSWRNTSALPLKETDIMFGELPWLPIDTAPKDGSMNLVWDGEDFAWAMWRSPGPNRPLDQGRWAWHVDGSPMDPPPTHWLPLTEPRDVTANGAATPSLRVTGEFIVMVDVKGLRHAVMREAVDAVSDSGASREAATVHLRGGHSFEIGAPLEAAIAWLRSPR
jgi:hypothetical protein